MRFFSNEAKDDADQQDDTTTTVPQQRAGSPWQHTEPQSSTVSGDDPDRTTPLPEAKRDVAFDDGSPRTLDDGSPRTDPAQVNPAPGKTGDDDRVDLDLEDRDTTDDPNATQPLRTGTDTPRHAADNDTLGKGATVDEKSSSDLDEESPSEFGKVSDKPSDTDEPENTDEPLVTPVPVAESEPISGPAPFFPETDTQPLRDRWRDVQLRFVDDPKGATSDASGLVDEAVDKLAAALRDHRGSFAKGTDDTEALRVEFRSYRDILDRLLGL